MKGPTEAPPVQMTLPAYPSAPARVGLVYQPFPARAAKTALAIVVFWGLAAPSFWLPPHYPWPVLCFCTGAWLAHEFLMGSYRVRWFVGMCPRCGRHLRIGAGTRIRLPHTVTCFTCHFEPTLEVQPEAESRPELLLRHVRAECTGTWTEQWMWDERFLGCGSCGARQPATPELRRLADAENERGDLMRQLADEGRFLN
jgi:hypothetical protein